MRGRYRAFIFEIILVYVPVTIVDVRCQTLSKDWQTGYRSIVNVIEAGILGRYEERCPDQLGANEEIVHESRTRLGPSVNFSD